MSGFALVTFKGERREKASGINFFRHLLNRLGSLFIRPKLEEHVKKIELYEDLNAYIIKLPYYTDEIVRHKGRLHKFFAKFSAGNDIKYCFLPKDMPDNVELNGCMKFASTGRLLFKSVLIYILDEIYAKREVAVSELDICIVEGESRTELFEIIDLLSPFVKFITIAAKDKTSVEAEMGRICDDTGLCARVTSEYRSCFKDSDLIINLGGLENAAINPKINPNAVILNYGGCELNKLNCENTILNGFIVDMRGNILKKIDDEVLKTYEKTGIIEIILLFKAGMEDKIKEEYIDKETVKGLTEAFEKCGCSIREFVGRRNRIKSEDIAI